MAKKEFKVNDFITVKLIGDETVIFVKGKRFRQCKYLLLYPEKGREYGEIRSIDEAAEHLSGELEYPGRAGRAIPPELEFKGHCSNLQAWAEHDYDTRLMHSNIAFPLLKRLAEVGDPKAKKVFKEEIAYRITEGTIKTVNYLIAENYLQYLNAEELETVFRDVKEPNVKELIRPHYLKKYIKEKGKIPNIQIDEKTAEQLKNVLDKLKSSELKKIKEHIKELIGEKNIKLINSLINIKPGLINKEHITRLIEKDNINLITKLANIKIDLFTKEHITRLVKKKGTKLIRQRYNLLIIRLMDKKPGLINKEHLKELINKNHTNLITKIINIKPGLFNKEIIIDLIKKTNDSKKISEMRYQDYQRILKALLKKRISLFNQEVMVNLISAGFIKELEINYS